MGPPGRTDSAAALVIGGLLIGALLGFAAGAKVAGRSPQQTSAPPTAPMVDVLPDAVSQRLRDAYYGGGGALEVCIAGDAVVCHPAIPLLTARHYSDITRSVESDEMTSLKPSSVPPGRIIVAGDFGPVDGAAIASLDQNGPTNGRLLIVVNPDRRGIDYVDLGDLTNGTYLVAIGVPSWRGSPTALIEIVVR